MLQSVTNPYPGEAASVVQLLMLASEYREAACTLRTQGRKGDPLSWAPCRLTAIHSIELCFNALLLHKGMEPAEIRAMQHCLSQRVELASANGLKLRKRTAEHLIDITGNREYLVTRYGAEISTSMSEITRLMATLDEVAAKVCRIVTS